MSTYSILPTPYSRLCQSCPRLLLWRTFSFAIFSLLLFIHLSPMFRSLVSKWKDEWNDVSFRRQTVVTIPLLLIVLLALARFLEVVETRPGVAYTDAFLQLIPPRDMTWVTFGIIYAGLLGGIGYLAAKPRYLLLAMQAYVVTALLRMGAMFLLPLDPPPTILPLVDPLVEFFGTGVTLKRDLFFSGHTSTLFVLFLTAPDRGVKGIFLAATICVAACVLIQHVHYTIDVYAAPVFAYAGFSIVLKFQRDLPGVTGVSSGNVREMRKIFSK
jgi:hypothetical protein